MLLIRKFNKELDTPAIQTWWKARGEPERNDYIPALGFIVDDVAVGFVREAEGKLRIVDSYLTNPKALPCLRNEALNLITEAIVKDSQGYLLIALTLDSSISDRALRHGFVAQPNIKVLSKF